jgi:ferredoxin
LLGWLLTSQEAEVPYTRDDVLKATEGLTGNTIPVHVDIDMEQVVLAQPEMRKLLDAAGIIAVGNCLCREEEGNCDHPLDVCLALDSAATERIEGRSWRTVDVDEAIGILEKTYRQGLVHLAYRRWDGDINLVCSCCDCCCQPLNRLKRFDVRDGIAESAFVARFDEHACVGCGACVDRCTFGAFTLRQGEKRALLDPGRCFGCGLCVGTCLGEALSLVSRGI